MEEVPNLTKDVPIEKIQEMMEMLAGDKQEYGKRQPGERCMYEIQRESLHRS